MSGFYGKLPARGDFVRSGLTAPFIAAWDGWAQVVLAGSREIMGEAWVPAWLEAPVWRFALPGGLCGPDTVVGLFMPSVDRAGRFFPLCFARFAPGAGAGEAAEAALDWLAAAEAAGRAALADDLAPEDVAGRLALPLTLAAAGPTPPLGSAPADCGLWWTEGAPRVAADAFTLCGLPGPERFAGMLDARFTASRCELATGRPADPPE